MKKLFCLLIALLFVPLVSFADLPDISGLSYDELIELREKINLAIWNCSEWQEVEVPAGVWEVGVDIPAGKWTITPVGPQYMNLWYGDKLNASGTDAGYGWDSVNGYNELLSTKTNKDGSWKDPSYPHYAILTLKDGWFVRNAGTVTFTPYTGKADLGFK